MWILVASTKGAKKMIDEKKLIEILEDWKFKNEEKGYDTAKDLIQEMLYIVNEQPKTDWIPCEERLPNTLGVYQTVRKVMEGDRVYYLEGASYFDGQNTWHNDIGVNHGREYPNVVAWQRIQPYKKEGNSNENT